MDLVVEPLDGLVEPALVDSGLDVAGADGVDDRFWGEFVRVDQGVRPSDLVGGAGLEAIVGQEADRIVRRWAPSVTVEHREDEPVEYSLDGELLEARRQSMTTRPVALTVAVGEGYEPDPDAAGQ